MTIAVLRVPLRMLALAGLALLCGCSLKIGAVNPRPNIAIARQTTTLGLVISEAVFDEFAIPKQNGIMGAKVHGWRSTLKTGFDNGFGDSARLVEGPADTTITLDAAELELVPAAVSGYYGVVAIDAQVRFKITVNKDGVERRAAGTSHSKKSATTKNEVRAITASAVESMYEIIAKEVFVDSR